MPSFPNKKKRIVALGNLLLKLLVVGALGAVLVVQVYPDIQAWRTGERMFPLSAPYRWGVLVGAIALMPLNWSLEALKWQKLVRHFTNISFRSCVAGVVAGVTISLFTPNRIGEYGGRILLVEARHNWRAVIATVVGSFSQLLVTWSFGLIALVFFLQHWAPSDWVNMGIWIGLVGLGVVICFAIFFHLRGLEKWTETRWGRLGRGVWKQLRVLRRFHRKDLWSVLLYSGMRYGVYTLQYALMIWFFDDSVSLWVELTCISTLFLLQTGIPFPPLLGVLARGELAVLVWGAAGVDAWVALGASYGLFILNLIVPALLGAGVIVRINVMKSIGYE